MEPLFHLEELGTEDQRGASVCLLPPQLCTVLRSQKHVLLQMALIISRTSGFWSMGEPADQRFLQGHLTFGLFTKGHPSCRVTLSAQPPDSQLCPCSVLLLLQVWAWECPLLTSPLLGFCPGPSLFPLYSVHIFANRLFIKFSPNYLDLSVLFAPG